MEELAVERTVWIAALRERVWQAITEAEQIREWWGDYWEFAALEVGATVKFGDPDDLMMAKIDVVDPPRQFRVEWPPQEQYHSIRMFTNFLLEEENGGTRVTVSETGFEALPEEIRHKRLEQTGEGYETVLADLKALLERRNP